MFPIEGEGKKKKLQIKYVKNKANAMTVDMYT